MGVKINVSTQRNQYVAGEVVEGIVNVIVTAKTPEGSSGKELKLRLVGTAHTSVPNGEQDVIGRSEKTKAHDEFLSYEVQLASFNGKAATGTHNFPFSMVLPPGLYSSMQEQDFGGDYCSVDYGFEARLHRPGILNFDATDTSSIEVFSRPPETAAVVPVVVGPETQSLSYMCCFSKGSMALGFEADRSAAKINSPVKLTVFARNDSSAPVKSMDIEVKQVCKWHAKSDKGNKKRTIVYMVVPGSELGEAQDAVGDGDQSGRSNTAVGGADQQTSQEMQGAGPGTRHEVLIPDGCLQSLESSLIDVTHTLSVSLITTSSLITSPEVSMPLHVHGRGAVLDASAETTSTGISLAEAKAGEGLGLVSVPQSAVKLEFGCGFSDPLAPAK